MKIILLGAPGAGKGTQAAKLKEYYNIPHISTGDAFRSNISQGTEIGLYAKSFMDKGLLVPDEVVIKIVESRLKEADCKDGFLLDGFPRTIPQAEALDALIPVDCVVNIDADHEKIVKRLTGRRSCKCGEVYHISTYSAANCAKCGGELYTRDDDKEETIRKRLSAFVEQTAPLVEYYGKQGKVVNVNGNQSPDSVFAEVVNKLQS
ncbi:MAG: adenylate kinase [Christensenellaceae bacterium]|jgi:adenylate kinase|nr:adenylate kinase [Christensenellaceae bacterium]